jgi:hypothetical protein
MKNRRMDIVDLGIVIAIQGLVSPLVGFANGDSTANPTSAQPIREHVRIMIAPNATLAARHPTELGGPQNDGVLEESTLL